MAKIFGMCGKKQCGKNSLCNFFKELLPNARVIEFAFAKALKDLAVWRFNIPSKSCHGSDADKNYPIATWGKFFSDEILNKYKKQNDSLLSGREFLQMLGTDILREGNRNGFRYSSDINTLFNWLDEKLGCRALDPTYNFKNIWTDILVEDISRASDSYDIITVSDVRFFNEIDAIKSVDGKLIRLYRDAKTTNSIPHPSELEMEQMQDSLFDYILYEDKNVVLSDLRIFATNILMNENLLGGGALV